MRRIVGLVLIGLGAFFLTLAPLVRFYAARQLVAAPLDVYTTTTLRADNATYFDAGNLRLRQGVTLAATNTTRGDVRASNDQTAVWDIFTALDDTATGTRIDVTQQRTAFDRRTGEQQDCCGASVGNNTNVKMTGINTFWPIGTEKRTYQRFDVNTRRAWPIVFEGEETIKGIEAYRFKQNIPPTKTSEVPEIPGSFLGLGEDSGNVAADRFYEAAITIWVDPRTGATVNQQQSVRSTLRTKDGIERLIVAQFDLKMIDSDVTKLTRLSADNATSVTLITTIVPIGALVLGLIALGAGVALTVLGDRRRATII